MSGTTQAEAQVTRYLLGLASPGERERLESKYFGDDDVFGEILSAEDDLIDAYARGKLSAMEQYYFEQWFLNSASGHERVQFARTLAGFVADTRAPEKPSPYQPGFFSSLRLPRMALRFAVVGLLALALATTWLLVQQSRVRNELRALRIEREALNGKTEQLRQVADAERTRNAESTAQIEKLQQELALKAEPESRSSETKQQVRRSRSPLGNSEQKYAATRRPGQVTTDAITGNVFAQPAASSIFDLAPGTLRSAGGRTNTVTVRRDAKLIVFRLKVESAGDEYYRAFIETVDGDRVRWFDRFKSLGPTHNDQSVQLPPIPAGELPAGVYVLSLHAQQPDGSFLKVADYSFTVTRN